ncbi:MAG: site-2 protease family protein [Gammaproteobacteria bacterium]|nr:MAG: site-2 protease family protein [Gammaproteobacteria bacterium]
MELTIIQKITIWAIPILFAITLHEVAHGWVASFFGDKTAKLAGRLSLNPLKHVDLVGTIILPLLMLILSNFIFGWAKPVPVDARNMRHPRRDMAIVALAGPVANLIMAFGWGAVAKLGLTVDHGGNSWMGVPLVYMGSAGIMINAILAVLNLIPLPPLDGGRVLLSLLPPRLAYHYSFIEPYSFFILVLLLMLGVLSFVMGPPVSFVINFIGDMFGL